MRTDKQVTDAEIAFGDRLVSHVEERRLRFKRLAQRAERRACGCGGVEPWMPVALKTSTFDVLQAYPQRHAGLYQHVGIHYCGLISQSRLFALLEIFEIRVPSLGRIDDLEAYESGLGPRARVLIDQAGQQGCWGSRGSWQMRNRATAMFLSGVKNVVDVVRLTVATGAPEIEEEVPSSPWQMLTRRRLFVPDSRGQSPWMSAIAFEANSADCDRV